MEVLGAAEHAAKLDILTEDEHAGVFLHGDIKGVSNCGVQVYAFLDLGGSLKLEFFDVELVHKHILVLIQVIHKEGGEGALSGEA